MKPLSLFISFAYLCFTIEAYKQWLTTKTGKINLYANGIYDIKIQSDCRRKGHNAKIWVNTQQLSQNNRGHNIVVIDPETDTYQSAAFDTYTNSGEGDCMIEFLKGVKLGSIVLMAIRDSTWPVFWTQMGTYQVNFMDRFFGSETYKDDPNRGCPFMMWRRPWALITKKIPLTSSDNIHLRRIPSWRRCVYNSEESSGPVVIEQQYLFKDCPLPNDDFCNNDDFTEFYGMKEKVWKSRDNIHCNGGNDCHLIMKCNERYSYDSRTARILHSDYKCGRNGNWPTLTCPKCESLFRIGYYSKDKETNYRNGEEKVTFRIGVNTHYNRPPAKEFFYIIKLNNMVVATYNPRFERSATNKEIRKIAQLSPQYNLYNYTANPLNIQKRELIVRNHYSIRIKLKNLDASHANTTFQFHVVDTIKKYALDYVHTYTEKLIYND